MSCEQIRRMINGYLDGELDLIHALEVEQHLEKCAECSGIYKNQQTLHTMMNNKSLYYKAPIPLRQNVRQTLRRDRTPILTSGTVRRWMTVAAVLGCVILVGMLWRTLTTSSLDDVLTQEVLSSHLRSLMVDHLSDVISSDQHTVKPWFDGKLNFSPSVVDLSTQGFPLIGGRLDYLENKPVAALVYERRKHIINLFIWPTSTSNEYSFNSMTKQGYQLFHWTQAGMTYWVVSDLNNSELQNFVQMYIASDPLEHSNK